MKIVLVHGQNHKGSTYHIAKMLAEELGYDYYDSELTQMVAQETGFDPSYIADAGEYAPGKSILSYALGNTSPHVSGRHVSASDYLWATQSRIINELAEKGNCVIVGRCADFILRDRNDCLNVFIHSGLDKRVSRVIEEHRVPDEEAEKHVKDRDRKRADHYRYITGQVWGDVNNYHICLDSDVLGLDACIELIVKCYGD